MSMFDWMPNSSSNNNGRIVSTRFWIYWVVTVPLTLGVMVGWYIWYKTADAAWRKVAKVEMEAEEEDEEEDEEEKDLEGGSKDGSIRSSKRSPSVRSGKRSVLHCLLSSMTN